ncbi:uncharacterized protein LOC120782053 [Bactrocera tryoni]|uniref:uncharacterized protein LOC120782053 n=1 Tax=Bactrocera tryoni TaxID=59916 RepID=UPI001A9634D0|nr:uncharacterized protein LOC120782053 [Bactrocera tryoni]
MQTWISYFGVPLRITTDLGGQFESDLFRKLADLLGFKHQRTTSYPQSNGLIERFHRQLKSSLLCHNDSWYDALPAVLLGLRAAFKEDIQATPPEIVFGEPVRLPGEFLTPSNKTIEAPELVKTLRKSFQNLTPTPASRHDREKIFISKDLANSTHVFIRNDKVKQSFSSPYDGPFPVMDRYEKYYKVLLYLKPAHISIDHLKPAYLCSDDIEHLQSNPSGYNQCNTTTSDTNPYVSTTIHRSQKRGRYVATPTLNISLKYLIHALIGQY